MNRIKELRKEKGITVKELADILKISQSMLTNYENSSSLPRNNEIWGALADYFDVSIPYLMGLTSRPEDYINSPFEDNEKLVASMKPVEIQFSSWDAFQAIHLLDNLDSEDLKKTIRFMQELLLDKN